MKVIAICLAFLPVILLLVWAAVQFDEQNYQPRSKRDEPPTGASE